MLATYGDPKLQLQISAYCDEPTLPRALYSRPHSLPRKTYSASFVEHREQHRDASRQHRTKTRNVPGYNVRQVEREAAATHKSRAVIQRTVLAHVPAVVYLSACLY